LVASAAKLAPSGLATLEGVQSAGVNQDPTGDRSLKTLELLLDLEATGEPSGLVLAKDYNGSSCVKA
jgi:hypothetical protein